MVPKTGPHSGSKVRRLRNGPHFGSCLKTSFAQNTKKKIGNKGCAKIGVEKSSPSAKMAVYLRIPRAPGTRNNYSSNSSNNSNSNTVTVAAAVVQC